MRRHATWQFNARGPNATTLVFAITFELPGTQVQFQRLIPARPAEPASNSSGLLALYERACTASLEVFQAATVAQLGRLVGCDGAVWGRGGIGTGGAGVRFESAEVFGRAPAIVTDYGGLGEEDPVARAFFERPEQLQSIQVNRFYRGTQRRRMREYLNEYEVSHLMLGGGRAGPVGRDAAAGGAMSWITLYRSDVGKPFVRGDAALFAALLPHCVQAHDICAALGLARAARNAPPASPLQPSMNRPARPNDRGGVCAALSAREHEMLTLVARGFTYSEAAIFMGVAIDTVRSHVRNLYDKLGAHSKTEAVFEARLLGWLD